MATPAEAYDIKAGKQTSEVHVMRDALRRLNDLYRDLRAAEIEPRQLKQYQQSLVAARLARKTNNAYGERVRRMVKWARTEDLLPRGVLEDLKTVSGLKAGRTRARDPEPIKPVPQRHRPRV